MDVLVNTWQMTLAVKQESTSCHYYILKCYYKFSRNDLYDGASKKIMKKLLRIRSIVSFYNEPQASQWGIKRAMNVFF